MPPDATPAPPSLWRDPTFVLFWFARAVSLVGTALTTVVLPLLLFRLTGSALQTGLLTALNALPYLLFGLPAGALADRVDRKRLMIGCDLLNAALLASIPLANALGMLTLPHLYAVAFLSAATYVWFDAANFGALPALVGRARLIEANSLLWSTGTLITIAVPALAGLLATTLGPAPTLGLDALSYLLSALALALTGRAFSAARATPATATSPRAILRRTAADIGEGLRFIWRHRLVRALTLLGTGNSFTGGAVIGLLVVYGVRALGLGQEDARLGILYTAGALGALGASLALPRLTQRVPVGRITLFSLCLNPVLLLGLAVAPTFAAGLVLFLLWEATYSLTIINGIALRQLVTPEAFQSRVNATARMIAWGGAPFGAAVGGVLAEATSIRATYAIMALGVTLSAALGWCSPLRDPAANVLTTEAEGVA